MRKSRNPRSRFTAQQLGKGAILIALALGGGSGCTREFYREWANQDVSEAVFEKSRDPRWRMDIFSVEPPALSRFADPYDQEVPPAPPDDPAAEALSPVPQWPDNRLLIPAEGTGYLDLLEYWHRDQEAKQRAAGLKVPDYEPEYWERADNARHAVTDPRQPGMPGQPLSSPAGPPVPPETGSPFANPANACACSGGRSHGARAAASPCIRARGRVRSRAAAGPWAWRRHAARPRGQPWRRHAAPAGGSARAVSACPTDREARILDHPPSE